jgi:hypothetical protein
LSIEAFRFGWKIFAAAGLAVCISAFFIYQNNDEANDAQGVPPPPLIPLDKIPKIIQEEAIAGNKENPRARQEYEMAMVIDPATGAIPSDIKRREYRFSSTLPDKKAGSALRLKGTQNETWNSIGPFNIGGRTRALAIDVSDENIIIAGGVSGGIWRSEDNGKSWSKTTVPSNLHSVTCIVQDTRPGKTQIWYYGTGEYTSNSASKKGAPFRGDGVFKSVDGGKTWQQLASTSEGIPNNYNSQFQYIHGLHINENNQEEDELFIAAVGGLFRSLDGGLTLELVLGIKIPSTPDTNLNFASLSEYTEVAQSIDGTYYAVFSQSSLLGSSPNRGVYRSEDGLSWTNITPASWPRTYARTLIATSPGNSNEVYFLVNAGIEMIWKYRYLGGNGSGNGGIWGNLSANVPDFGGEVGDYDSQSSYNMVLEIHPENADIIFLGGTNLYRSTDGFNSGNNTSWIGGYDTTNNITIRPNHFVDQHAVVFYPSNPNKMLSSNDGGVYVTEDNTREFPIWRSLNNGFVTAQFYTLALDEFGEVGDIMGGLQDNGTLIANKPIDLSFWNNLIGGDGGYAAIAKNATFHMASFQFGKTYKFALNSNMQTQSFTRIDPAGSGESDNLLFVNPFVMAPENQNLLYFAGGDVIWRNLNTSQIPLYSNEASSVNWQKLYETEIQQGIITALNATYNPSGHVYFGTSFGQLFRIENANSAQYTVEEITSPVFPEGAYLSSIAFDKKNSETMAITFSNYNVISVFYSQDGGSTFDNISGNLEENPDGSGSGPSVRWIEIVTKNNDASTLFVGTSTGLYSTEEPEGPETIWKNEGSDAIGNVLVTMIRYSSGDGYLVAATHGNGLYQTKLSNVWPIRIENQSVDFIASNPYPNPFREQIIIPLSIPTDGLVRATIYSSLGQKVKTILWADQFAGQNSISWDGTNDGGSLVTKGTYFCQIEFEDKVIGIRLIYEP